MNQQLIEEVKTNHGTIKVERVNRLEAVWTHDGGSVFAVCGEFAQHFEQLRRSRLVPFDCMIVGFDTGHGAVMYQIASNA